MLGIPVIEAIKCFRVLNIMRKLGVDEEGFESFVLETYNKCSGFGLDPEQIGSYLDDLVNFWSASESISTKVEGTEERIPFFSGPNNNLLHES